MFISVQFLFPNNKVKHGKCEERVSVLGWSAYGNSTRKKKKAVLASEFAAFNFIGINTSKLHANLQLTAITQCGKGAL